MVPIEGRDNVSGSRRGYKVRSYVGVRTARYAYFEYRRANYETRSQGASAAIGAGRTTEVELYDLVRDPYELRNLAREPRYGAARAQLAGLTATTRNAARSRLRGLGEPTRADRSLSPRRVRGSSRALGRR